MSNGGPGKSFGAENVLAPGVFRRAGRKHRPHGPGDTVVGPVDRVIEIGIQFRIRRVQIDGGIFQLSAAIVFIQSDNSVGISLPGQLAVYVVIRLRIRIVGFRARRGIGIDRLVGTPRPVVIGLGPFCGRIPAEVESGFQRKFPPRPGGTILLCAILVAHRGDSGAGNLLQLSVPVINLYPRPPIGIGVGDTKPIVYDCVGKGGHAAQGVGLPDDLAQHVILGLLQRDHRAVGADALGCQHLAGRVRDIGCLHPGRTASKNLAGHLALQRVVLKQGGGAVRVRNALQAAATVAVLGLASGQVGHVVAAPQWIEVVARLVLVVVRFLGQHNAAIQ